MLEPTLTDTLIEILTPTHLPSRRSERPEPEWERGPCPMCSEPLVSNAYYHGGKGYVIWLECWGSLGTEHERTCDYRRVL